VGNAHGVGCVACWLVRFGVFLYIYTYIYTMYLFCFLFFWMALCSFFFSFFLFSSWIWYVEEGERHITTTYISRVLSILRIEGLITSSYPSFPTSLAWEIATRGKFVCSFSFGLLFGMVWNW